MENPETKSTQKRRKGIETTHRILEVSANLFAHKGYDRVSVNEIAIAVGIKESSLYNHFSSKSDILDKLFEMFIQKTPESRPSDLELENMILIMQPEEIFKNILFHFGSHIDTVLENIAMIINIEKFRNAQAAKMYFQYVVNEPAGYYERLITKMADHGMIKPVNPRLFAEQYNYVSIALTKEYFMVKNGLADMQTVIKYMVTTIHFFCSLMKVSEDSPNESERK